MALRSAMSLISTMRSMCSAARFARARDFSFALDDDIVTRLPFVEAKKPRYQNYQSGI